MGDLERDGCTGAGACRGAEDQGLHAGKGFGHVFPEASEVDGSDSSLFCGDELSLDGDQVTSGLSRSAGQGALSEARQGPSDEPAAGLFIGLAQGTKEYSEPNAAGTNEGPFYDGAIFHRIIDGFMIQGGDPTSTGTGGPGYTIPDEFSPGLAHTGEGIFSMANAGPNTGGSQFFMTLAATPWLDGKHAIFGKVIEGMEVVRAIGQVPTKPGDRPMDDVVMEKVTASSE